MHEIDPHWAWQVFEPTKERPWDLALAAHLFRRADYSRHVLRSMRQGFKPLSFLQFGEMFARSFYLIGRAGPMGVRS